jgi:hypothetical protein
MTSADELADALAAQHERYFKAHPKGQIAQTVMIERPDGDADFLLCAWANPIERVVMLEALRAHVTKVKAVRYAVWSEAWIKRIKIDPKDPEAARKAMAQMQPGDVSRDPERAEIIFTMVVEPNGTVTMRQQEIERDKRGRVKRLVRDADDDIVNMGGALANLFPPPTVN